jgi:Cu(I)/Ag(I) efflux system membrane fusion protein
MSLPQSPRENEPVPPNVDPQSKPATSEKLSFQALTRILRITIVRVRFIIVLLGVLFLVDFWHQLRDYRDRMLRDSHTPDQGAISTDTEYWCPMCPGVVSDWPSKCPICNMTLVRRLKGEHVPLPDGVLARMQFSPYRIQLAGIRTAAVEYRLLRREVVLVGQVQRSTPGTTVEVGAEAFASDLPFLKAGLSIAASIDGLTGHLPFRGRIIRIESGGDTTDRGNIVRIQIDDPDRELHAGTLATVRTEGPIALLPWWRRAIEDEWRNRAAAQLMVHSLSLQSAEAARIQSLLEAAVQQAMLAEGVEIAVPCSAVIDHGTRKVAFLESGPGMFDAVEVTVGPRCGDFYPILRGLKLGQRVAAAGAFLIDAEMWLNHDLSATWFGATYTAKKTTGTAPTAAPTGSTRDEDQKLIAKQKICPVTGAPLDSMDGPVRLEVSGRIVFICCEGCTDALRKNPTKYLAKLK